MINSTYDCLALAGKFVVEGTKLPRDQKELAKLCIDSAATLFSDLKRFSFRDLSVMGLSMEMICRIKETAMNCGIDKVTIFPFPITEREYLILIRMYGGDSGTFKKELEVVSLKTDEKNELIDTCEEKYGVIIYERK